MLTTITSFGHPIKTPKRRGKQAEGLVVNACIKWLWANGCFVWRNNTGALPDKYGRTIHYGHKGSADIIGVNPHGLFLAVEAKSAKGKLSPDQALFRDRVQAKQGVYVLARSTDDLEARKAEILRKMVNG